MDLSGSVAPFRDTYRDAAKGFIAGLKDSGSSVAMLSFGDESPRANTVNYPAPLVVNETNLVALNAQVDDYWTEMVVGQGTNWDAGLYEASVAAATLDYDLVLVLTDGNPTFSNPGPTGTGSETTFRELERAIFSANAIKDTGARVITVGIGEALSDANLGSISGTGKYAAGMTINETDFTTSPWSELSDLLANFARGIACRATVTVNKLEASSGEPVAGDDWQFVTTASTGSLAPGGPQVTDVTGANPTGSVAWTLDLNTPGAVATVQVSETDRPGWSLESAACTVNGLGVDETMVGSAVTVPDVVVGDAVACSFTNRQAEPAIHVVKSSATTTITAAGQVVPYRFTVTNVGNLTLTGITVTDPHCAEAPAYQSGDTSTDGQLPPGAPPVESWIYTCSHTVSQAEIDTNGNGDGDLVNTVTADSTQSGPDTDTLGIPITRTPAIRLAKSVSPLVVPRAGGPVVYTVVLDNPGNVTLSNTQIDDTVLPMLDWECTLAGDPSAPWSLGSSLRPGEVATCAGNHTLTPGDLTADGTFTNVATAQATPSGGGLPITSPPGTATVTVLGGDPTQPGIAVAKTAKAAAGRVTWAKGLQVPAGSMVTYTYKVTTGTGNEPIRVTSLVDDKCSPVSPKLASDGSHKGDLDKDGLVDPGETWVYRCTQAIWVDTTNIAVITGTDANGSTVTAHDSTTVTVDTCGGPRKGGAWGSQGPPQCGCDRSHRESGHL